MVQTSDRFAIWIATGRIFSMLATFVMPLVLTRYLTVTDYGVFSQFFTLYTVLYAMFAIGTHTNLFFFYPNASKENQDIYVSNTFSILAFLSVLSGIILIVPTIQQALWGDSALSEYKTYVIICIALAVPINIISPLFSVREDKVSAVAFPAFVAISRIMVIVVVAILSQDLHVIMIGMVVYQIVMTFLALWYSLSGNKFKIDWYIMKEQLCYSLPFGIAVTLQLLSNYFDKIVSIKLLTPTDYAIYSVAFLSIPGVNQLYDSLAQVNIINMSKCYQAKETDKIMPLYKAFVQKTLSFSTPIIIAAALYAEEIIGFLFTEEYNNAATYFRIYSLTFLIAMFGAGTILRSTGNTKMSMYAFIVSCMVGLPLTYVLISSYGIDGAILAAVINIVLPRFIQIGFEIHVMHQSLLDYLPWKNILIIMTASLICLVPLWLIKFLCTPPLIVDILLAVVYIIGVYWFFIRKDLFIVSSVLLVKKSNQIVESIKRRIH